MGREGPQVQGVEGEGWAWRQMALQARQSVGKFLHTVTVPTPAGSPVQAPSSPPVAPSTTTAEVHQFWGVHVPLSNRVPEAN